MAEYIRVRLNKAHLLARRLLFAFKISPLRVLQG